MAFHKSLQVDEWIVFILMIILIIILRFNTVYEKLCYVNVNHTTYVIVNMIMIKSMSPYTHTFSGSIAIIKAKKC